MDIDLVALQAQLNVIINNLSQVHVAEYKNIAPMYIAMQNLEHVRTEVVSALRAMQRRATETSDSEKDEISAE